MTTPKRRGPGNPPGSPYYSMPDSERGRPSIKLTLSREALARLDAAATRVGLPRSRVVEALLDEHLPRE